MEWRDDVDFLDLAIEENINNIVFTANSVVTNGKLVMGAGAALRIRNAYPEIDSQFGELLLPNGRKDYHVVEVHRPEENPHTVYALQVKRHYRDNGDFELCITSLRKLIDKLKDEPAVLNCPLIGYGGFSDKTQRVYDMVEKELKDE